MLSQISQSFELQIAFYSAVDKPYINELIE